MACSNAFTPESALEPDEERPRLLSFEDTENLRALVHQRLENCGWRTEVREMIRSIVDMKGVRNVRYEEIAAEVIPKARAMVPDGLRKELQLRVRYLLEPSSEPDI